MSRELATQVFRRHLQSALGPFIYFNDEDDDTLPVDTLLTGSKSQKCRVSKIVSIRRSHVVEDNGGPDSSSDLEMEMCVHMLVLVQMMMVKVD